MLIALCRIHSSVFYPWCLRNLFTHCIRGWLFDNNSPDVQISIELRPLACSRWLNSYFSHIIQTYQIEELIISPNINRILIERSNGYSKQSLRMFKNESRITESIQALGRLKRWTAMSTKWTICGHQNVDLRESVWFSGCKIDVQESFAVSSMI